MVMTTLIGLGVGAAMSAGLSAAQGGSVGDILKNAGIGAVTGAATAGVGSAVGGSLAGAIGSGLSKVGSVASHAASSSGSLLGKLGTGLTNVGGKMTSFGAQHGISATIQNVKSAITTQAAKSTTNASAAGGVGPDVNPNTLDMTGITNTNSPSLLGKIDPNTANNMTGNAQGMSGASTGTGGAPANITQAANGTGNTTPTNSGAANTTTGNVQTSVTTSAAKQGSARVVGSSKSGGTNTTTNTANGSASTFSTNHPFLAKVGEGIKQQAGQYGVQAGLSIISGIQSSKQASAANAIQQQSLLFQQQSYNESKAEKESTKAQLKQDAYTAYTSASLFGSNLYDNTSNANLLTSYNTNGTGNQGIFSILNTGVSTRKTSDLT